MACGHFFKRSPSFFQREDRIDDDLELSGLKLLDCLLKIGRGTLEEHGFADHPVSALDVECNQARDTATRTQYRP
ncbi:hypothetical protein D3C72_2438350 [compost metagenome]